MDQLAQEAFAELRNDASNLGMIRESLDALEDLQQEALANLGNPLLAIPFPNAFQISKRCFGQRDRNLSHPPMACRAEI